MKLKKVHVFWTTYFDSTLSRGEGRRIPFKHGIPEPRLNELERACRKTGQRIVASKEARYPKNWWRKGGYVAVEKSRTKGELMEEISKNLRRIRARDGGRSEGGG